MEKRSQLHGLFRDGQNLDAFALQRGFNATVALNSSFLPIPRSYMDQVAAVNGQDVSNYGYQLDCFFDYGVSMPLAAYSIPTLENPDGELEFVQKPGYKLR